MTTKHIISICCLSLGLLITFSGTTNVFAAYISGVLNGLGIGLALS